MAAQTGSFRRHLLQARTPSPWKNLHALRFTLLLRTAPIDGSMPLNFQCLMQFSVFLAAKLPSYSRDQEDSRRISPLEK
jgi:hypothetical protein